MNLGVVGVAERNPTIKNLIIVGFHYVLADMLRERSNQPTFILIFPE